MQKPVIYIAALMVVFIACGKDKFNTKPTLTIKSISSSTVPQSGQLQILFEFTDKEGDVSDSIFMKKIRINTIPAQLDPIDSFGFKVPDFPKKSKGDIQLNLDYNLHLTGSTLPPTQGNPPQNVADTMIYRFALRDQAGNISDTVQTDPIVIIR